MTYFYLVDLTLTIWPGQDGVKPLTVLTQDVQRLQFLLAECKRLKEMAGMYLAFEFFKNLMGQKAPCFPLVDCAQENLTR